MTRDLNGFGRLRRAVGAVIITCYDEPNCTADFRTASDPSVIRRQLEAAGWQVLSTRQGTIYRCPAHSRIVTPPANIAHSARSAQGSRIR